MVANVKIAMSEACRLVQAQTPEQIEQVRELFREYEAWVGNNICFRSFDKELAELPGAYAPPDGRLLLAEVKGELAGCVALRKIGENICEMKRLFVREEFRGLGIGRHLVEAAIGQATTIGYRTMRLDTLPSKMNDAIALYRKFGFIEIDPNVNPFAGVIFMELDLKKPLRRGGDPRLSPPQPEPDASASAEFFVGPTDLASALSLEPGDSYPAVFSTSRMVALMEIAASRVLRPYLDADELSVGLTVDVTHTAATPRGIKVRATARYLGREGKLYVFEVLARDNGGEIGRGTHKRAIISTERLLAGAERRNRMT